MHSLSLLLLALPALAIQVTSPTQFTVWDAASSSQTVSWSSVNTDATSFAIVLVNQDRSVLPTNDQVLAANVTTSSGSVSVTYPSGSWPVGDAFQVNLIASTDNINTIYAQSNDFNITSSGSSTASSSTSSASTASMASMTGSTLSVSNTASSPTLSGSAAGSSASVAAGNSTLPNTGSGSSGAATNTVKVGALVFVMGLVGAMLA